MVMCLDQYDNPSIKCCCAIILSTSISSYEKMLSGFNALNWKEKY